MPTRILAAVARKPYTPLSLEELELEDPRPNEAVIQMVASGICHSDLLVMTGQFPMPLPMVLGHEGAGVVVEAGAETGLQPGQNVALSFSACGRCVHCGDGHPSYCVEFAMLNYSGRRADGSATLHDLNGQPIGGRFLGQSSFATHALIDRKSIIPIRIDVPLKYLGGFGCGFITGAGAVVNVLRPPPGSVMAIIGGGAVGFAALLAARIAGCARIILVDRVRERLSLALELGATDVIDTSEQDLMTSLGDLPELHSIIDTTGVASLVGPALGRLAKRGTCVLIGVGSHSSLEVDMRVFIPGRKLVGSVEGDSDPHVLVPKLVELFVEGRFPVDRLMRHIPFKDIAAATSGEITARAIKPVLVFADA
jgi:aryl-alcohol dehydrogenase